MKVLVTQSCLTLCDPMDCSPPGSSVHGVLKARILEWVASPFSRWSFQPRDQTQVSLIAGGFFTNWATGEAPLKHVNLSISPLDWEWVGASLDSASRNKGQANPFYSTSLENCKPSPSWPHSKWTCVQSVSLLKWFLSAHLHTPPSVPGTQWSHPSHSTSM